MTKIEAKTATAKQGWFRRAALGAAFAAVGLVTLGAATTPAEAYYYHYGWYHPYYHYYPGYYGYGYGPVYYGWGWGWHGGWGYHHGWHHW